MIFNYPSYFWGNNREIPPIQPNNPTDSQRYELIKYILASSRRIEDFQSIVQLLSAPVKNKELSSAGKFKGVKVAVVGGGLAGLSAAFELRKFGVNITIFEASEDHIGGRVHTHYFNKDKNLYGELGAMRIPASHETTWHYINLFKLNTRPFIQKNKNAFIYVDNERTQNDPEGKNIKEKIYPKFQLKTWEKNLPWSKLNSYALEEHLINLHVSLRTEILRIRNKYSSQYLNLERLSVRQAMEVLGLSEDAINLISSVDPIVGSFLYNSYNEILQDIYPVNFAYLYEIVGGMTKLPLAFYNSLTSNNPEEYDGIPSSMLGKVNWRRGNWVEGIYQREKGGKVALSYKNKHSDKTYMEAFDYVVCAIPFSTLRNIKITPLFSNKKMEAIREINYSNAQKTLFLCDNRFWEKGGVNEKIIGGISFTDKIITSIVYPSDHGLDMSGVLLASYNLGLDADRLGSITDERRINIIKRQIEEVHGLEYGYLDNIVKEFVTREWNKEQWALGAFSMFFPEQKRIYLYEMQRPEYDNRIFFAGEHISCNHAWMQGALYSGITAANNLIDYLRGNK